MIARDSSISCTVTTWLVCGVLAFLVIPLDLLRKLWKRSGKAKGRRRYISVSPR
jgi:hypothetical protein